MPIDQSAVLAAGLVLIAALAGVVAWATATAARSRPDGEIETARREIRIGPTPPPGQRVGRQTGWRAVPALVAPASARQVARVVAFLFLASVAIVVAITHAWPESEAAIFALIATGTLLVVLFMDMLPPSALGRWRHPAEGLGAIGLLALLMALTGGIGSPFVVGFFLVVAGTALSAEGLAPPAIAFIAALTVAVVGIVTNGARAIDPEGLAWIGINAVGLILVADLSAAAARAQRQARDDALRASRFDALTGLFNRAFFVTTVEQEIRRSERMDRGFALLMLDLDDLKPVNDTFGHNWGDRLLKAVAEVLRQTIRFTDAAARYGGDEFVVLLPETDASGAYIVAETLRREIAALTLRAGDRNVRSSVSIGLVTYPQDGATIEQLVAAADVAMYESKRRGKNQIVGYRTRTERVATAIDVASAELVSPGQSSLGLSGSGRTGGDAAPWASRTSSITGWDEGGSARVTGSDAGSGMAPSTDRPTSSAGGPDPGSSPVPFDPPWLTRTEVTAAGDVLPAAPPDDAPGAPDDAPGATDEEVDRRSGADRRTAREASRSDEIRRAWDSGSRRPWIALPIDQAEPPDMPPAQGPPRD